MTQLARQMREQLTGKQAVFVAEVARGIRPSQAAEIAGYASPGAEGQRLLRHPIVQQALFQERQAHLQGPLAAKALQTMEALMGEGNPAGVRFQAASYILDRSGHSPKQQSEKALSDKDLSEMTEAELLDVISKARDAMDKAKERTIEGDSAPVSAEEAPIPLLPPATEPQESAGDEGDVDNLG